MEREKKGRHLTLTLEPPLIPKFVVLQLGPVVHGAGELREAVTGSKPAVLLESRKIRSSKREKAGWAPVCITTLWSLFSTC